MTASYLHRLLAAVPGMNVPAALRASATPAANTALRANQLAAQDDVTGTPTFLVGRTAGALRGC